ncbi:MAG: phosphate ABC transporter substrate-binding protein PstS family protein [Leuconostoc pseudomesenteroides]|uniref:phosphate ABC transporter substrate-binding protein PstS family protein n=1 Tax=Leuconostoc pseudomesenteroides TaxID=33968 RepID=UPI0039EB4C4D
MSKSHRGAIVSSIVVVAIVAALGTAYATRDQSASGTSITAVGSTALQPLVEAAGEEYAKENLGTFINVQGGGTGTGLSQVSQGAVDLGNSDVFAEEKEGIKASRLVDHQVAVVGIAPLLNKDNGVKNLSTAQLKAIFTGKITNWQEVGGKNLDIVIINRATGSGTRATFEKWALDGAESISAQEQDSSGMVRSIVATTPGAISYAAFGYIDSSVVAASVNGIKPNNQNVATGKYAIWSYEHVYTKGKPDAQVSKFLKYLTSTKIQSTLVPKLGYISIHDMKISRNVNGQVVEK